MKVARVWALVCLISANLYGQAPSYAQKLYYTCKAWGFAKYFHSNVSVCNLDWDSVLIAHLPNIKNAQTVNSFNDELDSLLLAAGPMTSPSTSAPSPLPPELRRNVSLGWFQDTLIRTDIKNTLDTIWTNFRPHSECWVEENDFSSSYYGWLKFGGDSLMTSSNTIASFPDEWNRSLLFFKYWNLVEYFNPYNYVADVSWDSVLLYQSNKIALASSPYEFYLEFKKATSYLPDVHVEGLTWSSNFGFPNAFFYTPALVLKYIPGKYVAVKSGIASISPGDEIVSVNGLTTTQWEDSLKTYVSAGDSSVFRRIVSNYMLRGNFNTSALISAKDSVGNLHSVTTYRNMGIYSAWIDDYFPNDTLENTSWKKFSCNVGYINVREITQADVNFMYSSLEYTNTLIFDLRGNPQGTGWSIGNLIFPQSTIFAKTMNPDASFPGTFSWSNSTVGINGNAASSYQGEIIVLVNENTQSEGEYFAMMLQAMPNVITIGSHTAGTDGNISYFNLSQDIHAGFTTVGVYYPNGDSTERIGIAIDSVVYPTQQGIRQHRDQVLEKALEIAGCWLPVEENSESEPTINIYPNPSSGEAHIQLQHSDEENITMVIQDATGKSIMVKDVMLSEGPNDIIIDISALDAGMYLLSIKGNHLCVSQKIIKW